MTFVLPFLAGFGLHLLQAGEGTVQAGPAAQADQIAVAGQLLDETVQQVHVAVHRAGPCDSRRSSCTCTQTWSFNKSRVADQNHRAVGGGFLELRLLGRLVGFVLVVLGRFGRAVRKGGLEFAGQTNGQGVI